MNTATAIMTLSPLANEVDCVARYYVDRIDRDHYGGYMPSEKAREVYRLSVGSTVQKRMLEELEPIRKVVYRTNFMFLYPTPEIPKELNDLMESVEKKWSAVFEELCGIPDKRVDPAVAGWTPPDERS